MTKTQMRALSKDLHICLNQIDAQVDTAQKLCQTMGIMPQDLRSYQGDFVMGPLLVAKATCLAALVNLELAGSKN